MKKIYFISLFFTLLGYGQKWNNTTETISLPESFLTFVNYYEDLKGIKFAFDGSKVWKLDLSNNAPQWIALSSQIPIINKENLINPRTDISKDQLTLDVVDFAVDNETPYIAVKWKAPITIKNLWSKTLYLEYYDYRLDKYTGRTDVLDYLNTGDSMIELIII